MRQLVERGHDVTVLAEDSMEHEVMADGRDVPALGDRTEPS